MCKAEQIYRSICQLDTAEHPPSASEDRSPLRTSSQLQAPGFLDPRGPDPTLNFQNFLLLLPVTLCYSPHRVNVWLAGNPAVSLERTEKFLRESETPHSHAPSNRGLNSA